MVTATYALPLSNNRSASAEIERSQNGQRARAQYRQGRGPSDLGLDYRVAAEVGDDAQAVDARMSYQTVYGAAELDVERYESDNNLRAGVNGSVGLVDGTVRASRRIGRAFGMVETPGFSDVRVYVDNREVGRTDKAGYLMLPALRPFESNRVRLEVEDLPLDARIGSAEAVAVPYDRAGRRHRLRCEARAAGDRNAGRPRAQPAAGRAEAGEPGRHRLGLGRQERVLADRRRRRRGRGDGRGRRPPLELPGAAASCRRHLAGPWGDRLPMKPLIVGVCCAMLLAPGPALAACGVQLQGVSFGNVDVMRREESTGNVKITCDSAVGFLVEIGGGNLAGGQRQMQASGGASLRYQLYGDPAHTHVWGDGQTIGSPIGGASDGSNADSFTIYGVIPSQPGTLPGIYLDTPLVTLSF